jgi:hypothetical protein
VHAKFELPNFTRMAQPTNLTYAPQSARRMTNLKSQTGKQAVGRTDISKLQEVELGSVNSDAIQYIVPNLAYLEDKNMIRVASASEKRRLLEAVDGVDDDYDTFDLAFMHKDHPVAMSGTLVPGSLETVAPCGCFDNHPDLLPEGFTNAVHLQRILVIPYYAEYAAESIPQGATAGIDQATLTALQERAMVALTPEQSGWADVLTDPSHSEILEWALYMGNREGQALTAQNALRILVTVREQERKEAVNVPVKQPGNGFSPRNKWQWSRADAGGLFGKSTAWTELSARLHEDGHPRCARCDSKADLSRGPLLHGPFVCQYHRYCTECLFSAGFDYGERKAEADNVKAMPLVGTQRFTTGCYGCARGSKFYVPQDSTTVPAAQKE